MSGKGGGSPDPATNDKARKLASLLSSYYQEDEGGAGAGRGEPGTPASSGSYAARQLQQQSSSYASARLPNRGGNSGADMDSPQFNANAFLSRTLRDSRLDDLISTHTSLTGEIQQLDSSMQQLVDQNYSKFITATDTIKTMKVNVESMDTRMQELQQLIGAVNSLNNDVDSVLCERRLKIEQLNQVRTLLAKLQSVFDLPKKMRSALEVGALHVAVAQHAQVAAVLRAYGHKGSFRKVAAESEALAREVAERLKARMIDRPEEAAECLQLMQRLGEPTEHLQDEFLDSVQERLGKLLATAGLVLKARAAAAGLLPGAGHVELPPGAEMFAAPRQELDKSAAASGVPGDGQRPPPEGQGPQDLPRAGADAGVGEPQEVSGQRQQHQGGRGAREEEATSGRHSLQQFVVRLDALFLAELHRTATVFGEVFEPAARKKLIAMARAVFLRYLKLVRRAFADLSATRAASAAGIDPSGRLAAAPGSATSAVSSTASPAPLGSNLGAGTGPGSAVPGTAGVPGVGAVGSPGAAVGDGAVAMEGVAGPTTEVGLAWDWGTAEIVAALRVVAEDLPQLQQALPELSPRDRASELMENVVRYHMTTCFSALEQRASSSLQVAADKVVRFEGGWRGPCPQPLLEELGAAGAGLQQLLVQGLDAIVAQMKVYEGEDWLLGSWHDVFADAMQGQLQQLLLSLLSRLVRMGAVTSSASHSEQAEPVVDPGRGPGQGTMTSAAGGTGRPVFENSPDQGALQLRAAAGPLAPPTALLLLLALLSRFLERQLLPHVLEVAQQFTGGPGEYDARPPAFVAADVARSGGTAARQLLGVYAAQHARVMSLALRRGMDSVAWLRAREPRQPRAVCELVLQHSAGLQRELRALLPPSPQQPQGIGPQGSAGGYSAPGGSSAGYGPPGIGRGAGHGRGAAGQHMRTPSNMSQGSGVGGAGRGGAAGPSAAAAVLERGVSRIFRGQGKFDEANLRFNEHAIVAVVVCSGLQSFVEAVRLQTVGRAGLQQLQLDAYYLRPALVSMVTAEQAATVAALLDDVVRAATERSVDPDLLDNAVLDRILGRTAASTGWRQ